MSEYIEYSAADFRKNMRKALNEAEHGRIVIIDRLGVRFKLELLPVTIGIDPAKPGEDRSVKQIVTPLPPSPDGKIKFSRYAGMPESDPKPKRSGLHTRSPIPLTPKQKAELNRKNKETEHLKDLSDGDTTYAPLED